MEDESEKQKEIEEIQRRMEYLKSTDRISISEKIAITKKALEMINKCETEGEAVQ